MIRLSDGEKIGGRIFYMELTKDTDLGLSRHPLKSRSSVIPADYARPPIQRAPNLSISSLNNSFSILILQKLQLCSVL
eukprot:scaffold38901_cov65-Cyclotella_meneghiniana.AAC.3